ncbi:hypothetical protein ABZ545_20535 [Streptomyces abikoensis]|uniref:Uncharacterized protein n=1 Tax=Streptomyces abikoensis TaxID=97398 RepID=A0ABW7T988_9ACTN
MSTEAEALPPPPAPHWAPLPPPLPVPVPAPGPPSRGSGRAVAAAVSLVLGLGLIAGAVTGSCLAAGPGDGSAAEAAYTRGATLWRGLPVDRIFPATVHRDAAGPGGAPRDWIRLGVAPDSGCADAFDPLLATALAPVGCARLLRATYADATSSHVTTVGLLVTDADAAGMRALRRRFADEHLDERADLMPRPLALRDTPAARFGDAQRACWYITVMTDVPAVVYAVTGFTDGRTGTPPLPAARAVVPGATEAPAQAGLGHDATALAEEVERAYRDAAHRPAGREDGR